MSIFGQLDAEDVPDNAYWVKAGEYRAFVTNAYTQHNEKKNGEELIIVYTISDENSQYFNFEVRDRFDFYPDMDEDTLKSLTPTEKKAVLGSLSAIKRRLCGSPDRGRKGLGIDVTDLDSDWKPEEHLLNLEVDLAVTNNGDDNQYVNVRWANLVADNE